MSASNELRVFISSTFRDLQEEREHLVKKIFPEIRSLCRARGVTFTEVDLRWGITEEEAEREGIIRVCLEEIDRCRPYFIGILGERYGWTPSRMDAAQVVDAFPGLGLAAAIIEGASITEMEIVHGVLANPAMADHAFFYFRDRDATPEGFIDTDPESVQRLKDLKQRIRRSGFPVRENFTSAADLGEWLKQDLLHVLESEHPQSEAPGALELERRAHAAFAASRVRGYVSNPEYQREFGEWLGAWGLGAGIVEQSATPQNKVLPAPIPQPPTPLIIRGASGLGKSSLVAYLVEQYRRTLPGAFIVEHYVGASQASGSAVGVMRHVIAEISERFAIDEPVPDNAEQIERSFPNWLFRLEHLAAKEGIEVLIVIDALNQLDAVGQRLTWLPKTIPGGVKLVVSTTPGELEDRLSTRAWSWMEVRPLEDERGRQSIVTRYLGEFHKGVSVEQLRRLTGDAKAASPLYLRVVAEELRLHGDYETLDEEITRLGTAVDLDEVFQQVFERLERDYTERGVRGVLIAIWASRSGMSEVELLEVVGVTRLELSELLSALDYHLLRKDGLLGFFHDYLRRAVENRYVSDGTHIQQMRTELSRYFEGLLPTQRSALELLWQYGSGSNALDMAERDRRLVAMLSRPDVLVTLYRGETRLEILAQWTALVARGHNVEEQYRQSLKIEEAGREQGTDRGEVLAAAAELLQSLCLWAAAEELYTELVVWGRAYEQATHEVRGHLGLGWIIMNRGVYGDAMEHFEEALHLASGIGDRSRMGKAIGNMGTVHRNQGRYSEAMECFDRWLSICEELGDRSTMSAVIGNMGNVHWNQGEYAEAMECYGRKLSLCEELGDRKGVSTAISNMGSVHSMQGRYSEAMLCFEQKLLICEELGDRSGISNAFNNIGLVQADQGRYAEAMESYAQHLSICEELGHREGVAVAIGNMGVVHWHQGEYAEAMECYRRKLTICEELGDRRGRGMSIGNIGYMHDRRGEYDRALECFARASEEHRSIGYRHGLTHWLEGIPHVLLKIVLAEREMPIYLPAFVTGATAETWRAMSLRQARECAEECIGISDELQKSDTTFNGNVLVARIDAAEGGTDIAVQHLTRMLEQVDEDEQRAELHYWQWKFGSEEHRLTAVDLYRQLLARTPNQEYLERIEELQAAGEQS